MRWALVSLLAVAACQSGPPVLNPKLFGQTTYDLASAPQRGRAVVIGFGASHCEPCWIELPHLVRLQKKYEAVEFVLVLSEPQPGLDEAAQAIREHFGVPFAVLGDVDGAIGDAYGVDALPSLFVRTPDGKIVWQEAGFKGDTIERLDGVLARLIDQGP